jgi:hypothetical protein
VAPQAPVAPQAALTPQQIADIAAQTAARVGQQPSPQAGQQQQQQPKGMSQEEFNKTFNVVQIDEAGFTAMMGYAPESKAQVAALNGFAQNIVKQALTMAQVYVQSATRDLETRFGAQVAPITAEREAAVGAQLRNSSTHTLSSRRPRRWCLKSQTTSKRVEKNSRLAKKPSILSQRKRGGCSLRESNCRPREQTLPQPKRQLRVK